MLDFFDNLQKKRAFKKALEEIDLEEASVSKEKHTKDTSIQRIYQTSSSSVVQALPSKIKNPLRKPDTTAVDLKYFKDWRNVSKVSSSNAVYPQTRKIFDDDDDGAEQKINSPVDFAKPSPTISTTEMLNKLSAKPVESDKDEKFGTYFASRVSTNETEQKVSQNVVENDKKPAEDEKQVSSAKNKKTLRELVDIFTQGEIAKNERAKTVETQQKTQTPKQTEAKIKIEVVDLTDKKPEPKPTTKKPTKRKPRGKSKRRFDADVISSVDWK